MIAIFLDDIIDSSGILDGVRGIFYDHIWCLTGSSDMHITEFEYRLQYPCCMSIDFLYTIETTLSNIPRESRYLLDPDHSRIGDDYNIEFVIDPVNEDKRQKHDPVYSKSSPVESSTCDVHDGYPIAYEYSGSDKESKKVQEMKNKDNPMTMKGHHDLLIFF